MAFRLTLVLAIFVVLAIASCERGDARAPREAPREWTKFPPLDSWDRDPGPVTPVSPYPSACSDFHAQDLFPTIELEIEDDVLAAIRAEGDRETWRPAVFRYEDEVLPVQVRNRGNRNCGDKLQLAISFTRANPDARFHGLRRINLDNGQCRVLDERLALAFAREAGVLAPCANHARLEINGEFEGLFANLEVVDKSFLRRNFGPNFDDGNLWKDGVELRTNEDDPLDRGTLDAFDAATDLATLEHLMDVDQAVREWALEAVLPATDNWWTKGKNFGLYEHPERGFVFLPRDFDKGLPWNDVYIQHDPLTPLHHPATIVLADPYWNGIYRTELARLLTVLESDPFDAWIDAAWEQIHTSAVQDTSLDVSFGSSPPGRLRRDIEARIVFLRERLASE